jgi:hypothetical protein
LADVDPADYGGVLIPGEHGPMQDLAVNAYVARVLAALQPDCGCFWCQECSPASGYWSRVCRITDPVGLIRCRILDARSGSRVAAQAIAKRP